MSDTTTDPTSPHLLDRVVIRFAGDSGDGMQLAGDRFTTTSALLGNDLATFPDFPAEIRAPAGTLAGVSAFQVHISDHQISTPGDSPNVLVAMNPAALKANIDSLPKGAILIVNVDAFEERNLAKAGYETSPLADGSLSAYTVYEVPMTSITTEVSKDAGVKPRDAERSKNFFALGLISWLYTRPIEATIEWITDKYAGKPLVMEANLRAFKAGFHFGETAELFESSYEVKPAALAPGEYVNITGNTATAWGLIVASHRSGLPLFLGTYPITPASDILHELSKHKQFGVRTFQAEDEISGIGAALGAAFGGALGVTTTSGPGIDLKSETMGLAISLELPLLIIDIQRGGPSTGLPTKTEQADLLHAMYGRHGEAPLPIVAARTPSHCFHATLEAVRLAVKYRTPVILLSDGYLANGAEPWRLPDLDDLPDIHPDFAVTTNHTDPDGTPVFWPYVRDDETLARPWAPPGVPGLEHRIGGLEKADGSGNVAYDGPNHERMTRLRAAKIAGIAHDIPPTDVDDQEGAEVLVIGWGSTYGAIAAGVQRVRARGYKVAQAHLVHLNPFPADLGEVVHRYKQGPGPRSQSRPAQPAPARRVPGGCHLVHPGPRDSLPGGGDGGRHPPTDRGFRQGADGIPTGPILRSDRPGRLRFSYATKGSRVMTDLADTGETTTSIPLTTRKDWSSDQEVRWCPGCGDYSILAAVQMLMPELGVRRESTVFLSGIGCAARFPYYMNTYGLHSIHGRAPAIATGLAATRPDLDVWVVTGDGDSLSIGGNHLIHALRRNVNITILLFNNQIYGLTKGQYSPTSEVAKVTKSTPFGSLEQPFNPLSLALGAEAGFVARTHDMDRKHMMEVFRRAHAYRGALLRGDLSELQCLQRRGIRADHREGTSGRHAHPAGPR